MSFNGIGRYISNDHKQFIDEGIDLLREKAPWELVRISHAKGSPWDIIYNERSMPKASIPNEMIVEAASRSYHG